MVARATLGPSSLVFKGGTALRRCYFPGYRYSEDLDFSADGQPSWEEIWVILDAWCEWVGDQAGIHASRVAPAKTRGGAAFIEYVGPLRAANGRNIKIDVATDEAVRDGSDRRALLSEYSDLNGSEKTWERLWQQRLENQVRDLPDFNGVWRRVIRGLRQAGY